LGRVFGALRVEDFVGGHGFQVAESGVPPCLGELPNGEVAPLENHLLGTFGFGCGMALGCWGSVAEGLVVLKMPFNRLQMALERFLERF